MADDGYHYKGDATPTSEEVRKAYGYKWRPSIHMPKAAARIFLRVTDVRAERLHDITESDAQAEGATDGGCANCGEKETECKCGRPSPDHVDAFAHMWIQIHGESGEKGWHANPWVWVRTFERADRPEGP
jgi:hypothetical protein